MKKCQSCSDQNFRVSTILPFCSKCIKAQFPKIKEAVEKIHGSSRKSFHLPEAPVQSKGGLVCHFCVNNCSMNPGERGFCGMRKNDNGRMLHLGGTPGKGLLDWYHDLLPTNCVADWVCPGGSPSGYPEYSYSEGPESGYKNLAVFYRACTFNCLFCQNWHFRATKIPSKYISSEELASVADSRTSCICYFGGDPTPQLPHALKASRLALKSSRSRVLRICWETNGAMNRSLLFKMLDLSLPSGGCIKFDLKAFDERLHIALCGVSNIRTLENFKWLSQFTMRRPDPPLLIASTLMIPGYIEEDEVRSLARFIASLDRSIPYALLAFHPDFLMMDLGKTSKRQADKCYEAAKEEGLERVRIGNLHLLF
jgi:pyruvate formate lyase activating enzyme